MSVVYFIQCGDWIKIGVTTNLCARMEALASSNPHQLQLLGHMPGTHKLERELHRKFAGHRLRYEWFSASPEILAYVQAFTSKAEPQRRERKPDSDEAKRQAARTARSFDL